MERSSLSGGELLVVVLGGLSLDHTCQYTWSKEDPLLLAESQATRSVLASQTPLQILWMVRARARPPCSAPQVASLDQRTLLLSRTTIVARPCP